MPFGEAHRQRCIGIRDACAVKMSSCTHLRASRHLLVPPLLLGRLPLSGFGSPKSEMREMVGTGMGDKSRAASSDGSYLGSAQQGCKAASQPCFLL